jgi:UvrD-like helicase C-terminal domain
VPRRREPGSPHAFGELDELVLAYATTIHESQGSEYPAVVLRSINAAAEPGLHGVPRG